jgi:hypothetical protein
MSGALRELFSFVLKLEVLQHSRKSRKKKLQSSFTREEGLSIFTWIFLWTFFLSYSAAMFTFAFLRKFFFSYFKNEKTLFDFRNLFDGSLASAHVQEFFISSWNSLDCKLSHKKTLFCFTLMKRILPNEFWMQKAARCTRFVIRNIFVFLILFLVILEQCPVNFIFALHKSLLLLAGHEHTLETEYMNLTVVRSRKN